MQAFTLLVAGGYAHPMLPDGGTAAGHEAARRLNLAIARANANGADLPRLAAPAIGSAVGADVLETLLVGELLAGKPADVGALASEVLGVLARGGRSVQREGKPVTDAAETLRIVTEAVAGMLERRVPLLRRSGGAGRINHGRDDALDPVRSCGAPAGRPAYAASSRPVRVGRALEGAARRSSAPRHR